MSARVALVCMPFISVHRPALATPLLKAVLRQRGVECDIHNLFLRLAAQLDLPLYERLAIVNDKELAGERVFAGELFGPEFIPEVQLPRDYDPADGHETAEAARERLRQSAAAFLDYCLRQTPWSKYRVVGFSTVFQQNLASLALAKKIKERWPETIIVFGGANCEGEMGLELHRKFPFVDYVCSGEGDKIFPELVEAVLAGRAVPRIPGLIYRAGSISAVGSGMGAAPILNLDELPYPDYDDYFDQLGTHSLNLDGAIDLPFETSRGCWYGAKYHCTFCGLNDETIVFRSKTPARALAEIRYLAERYGVHRLTATDDIMDRRYLSELLPELERSQPRLSLFYETKANLTRGQMSAMKRAGIDRLQPGIESLSTPILQLMRKGCTALQNLQTLKWASELRIQVYWNFLSGFPGEDSLEYGRIAELVPSIVHLTPPAVAGFIRLDRFSPYFTAPNHMGMTGIRAAPPYRAIYPFSDDSLGRLAYFFHYDYADGRDPKTYAEPALRMMRYWQQNYSAYSFVSRDRQDTLLLRDRRPCAGQATAILAGAQRAAYQFLDSAHTLPAIAGHLGKLGYEMTTAALEIEIEDWCHKRWIVRDGELYLALAVSVDDIY